MTRFMSMKQRMKISKGGHISIPAAIRQRWNTSTVVLDDQDTRVVLEPEADDPIGAAEGSLAHELRNVNIGRLRTRARRDEQAAERRPRPG